MLDAYAFYMRLVNEQSRLSHFHMNNIGYCVSHECLSFIPIPPANILCTTNRSPFSMRLALSPSHRRTAAVGLSSRIFLPTTHQTYKKKERKQQQQQKPSHNSQCIVSRAPFSIRLGECVERISVFGVFWLKSTRCSKPNCQQSIILTAFSFKLAVFCIVFVLVLRVLRFLFSCHLYRFCSSLFLVVSTLSTPMQPMHERCYGFSARVSCVIVFKLLLFYCFCFSYIFVADFPGLVIYVNVRLCQCKWVYSGTKTWIH